MALPSHNPARAARRQIELCEKLDSERPVCTYCGCVEPVLLRPVPRKFLEEHHPLGQNHDPDLTVYACRNCHALMHERLLDAAVDLRSESDPIKRVAMMLRAEAVHFEALARTKRQQAALLERGKQ